MKRVRVRNNFIVYSLFDFSEMAFAIPCVIFWHDCLLSLCNFYWGGEMLLIYVCLLLILIDEAPFASLQQNPVYLSRSLYIFNFTMCIDNNPIGFT